MFRRIGGKRRRKRKPTVSTYDAYDVKKNVYAALQANYKPIIPWNRFSNYNKLLRVSAYILRLLQSNSAFRKTSKDSHPEEYLAAEKRIFILSQKESFAEELKDLRKSQSRTRSGRIIKFNPFLGSDNLL